MPVGAKMVVVFKACVEHRVLFALGHAFEFAFIEVSETDVFHCSSPLGGAAAQPCPPDRSSYSRRAQKKSTAESSESARRHAFSLKYKGGSGFGWSRVGMAKAQFPERPPISTEIRMDDSQQKK